MSQEMVLDFLRKNRKRWISRRDIEPFANLGRASLTSSMSKVFRNNKIYNIKTKKGKRNQMFLRLD